MLFIIISLVLGLFLCLLGAICLTNAKVWAVNYPQMSEKAYRNFGKGMFIFALAMVIAINVYAFGIKGMPLFSDNSSSSSYSSSGSTKSCGSCGDKFSQGTDTRYISRTGMCKDCYIFYCAATGKTPQNYD